MTASLFDKPEPVTRPNTCVIEGCSRDNYDGMCGACLILFGPYDRVLEVGEEWTPPEPADEPVESPDESTT